MLHSVKTAVYWARILENVTKHRVYSWLWFFWRYSSKTTESDEALFLISTFYTYAPRWSATDRQTDRQTQRETQTETKIPLNSGRTGRPDGEQSCRHRYWAHSPQRRVNKASLWWSRRLSAPRNATLSDLKHTSVD